MSLCLERPRVGDDRLASRSATAGIGTAASRGDPALGAIYLREQARLLRYLERRTDPDDAADILQDVFLKAAASQRLAHADNPGGYLCRMAQHALIDHARRGRRRIKPLPLIEAHDARYAPRQAEALEADDLKITFEHALACLPEKTRRVFIMHRLREMPHHEIHRELGISIATVEYHMGKAIAHLRSAVAARN